MKIYPKCLKGKESYISYDSHWLPCCWLSNFGVIYENSIFSRPEFDLTRNSIEEIIDSDLFTGFVTNLLKDPKKAPHACKKHCSDDSDKTSNDLHQKIRYE